MNKILGLLKNALFTIFDFVTNILAYLLKNVNEIS